MVPIKGFIYHPMAFFTTYIWVPSFSTIHSNIKYYFIERTPMKVIEEAASYG